MISEAELGGLVDAVRVVSREVILPRFRNLDATEISAKSRDDDLVTVADREAEIALSAAAERILPGVAVVGEEAVSADPSHLEKIGTAERCVIIDPIDGTANFVAGLGIFGVILAVVEQGVTTAGLLYDPLADDWVIAHKGRGAFFARDGAVPRKLATRSAKAEEAVGLLATSLYPKASQPAVLDAYSGFGALRELRCSCHDYRTIAFGQADFLTAGMMNPWDHAAGVLILQEAGGAAWVAGQDAYAPHLTKGPIAASGTPSLLPAIMAAEAKCPAPV